ncbi:E3 ubiquitin-protein ligase hrd1 [Sporothrix eucalyptigena]|uniref:RING-type E3 ubiquitin transferase n=1 Tax=Sporothrix eucalyptigena TaxID=1812306 RepID=A0ABP0BR11_9PEZI
MRLAWYAGASTVLAAGVVLSAFHQRANFYSAMVYLYQSNLCMMILVNLIALVYSSFVYSLQRVCFGQLRAIEVEQLYEKAWFAVTETCLAMTIFRDEIGGFFIVMFVALLTGKVWGWIGEGRIEALEQQPPANPRLFHTRLIISLFLSLVYDMWLLYYAVTTVIDQAKPDMMVMFLFEFAVLLITSLHTALRYSIILLDTSIVKRQTQERLQERRLQVREEREAILRRREEAKAAAEAAAAMDQKGAEEALAAVEQEDDEPLPDEDDIDEMDIEVAGWEAKGQYVLGLDLWTDFTKLCIYAVFFCVLLRFYGLPLHIIRDLFMTIRSFIKRLGALMKYRQAIKDMNRYADASEEDLARENTCIICREDMHVWDANDRSRIERTRPKKLPCGHILHLGCLKSWMERQQVCPTCRRSVVIDDAANANRNRDAVMFRIGLNMGGGPGGAGAQGAGFAAAAGAAAGAAPAAAADGGNVPPNPQNPAFPPANGQAPAPGAAAPAIGPPVDVDGRPLPPANGGGGGGGGLRMFNFGPIRLGFAQGGARDIQEMAQRLGLPGAMAGPDGAVNAAAPIAGTPGAGTPFAYHSPPAGTATAQSTSTTTESISQDLQNIERRIEQGILELQLASAEAQFLRTMLLELQRVRNTQHTNNAETTTILAPTPTQPLVPAAPAPGAEEAPAATAPEGIETGDNQASATTDSAPQTQATGDITPPAAVAPGQPQVLFQQPQGLAGQGQLFGPGQVFGQQYIVGQTGANRPFTFARGVQAQPGGPVSGDAPTVAVHMMPDNAQAIPAGSSELPPYVQIPAGWSLLPLQRFDNSTLAALNNNNGNVNGPVDDSANIWQTVQASQAGPSNSNDANDADDSSSDTAAPLRQSLQATVETAPETSASASSSSAPPIWGGSAQMFGGSSQENRTETQELTPPGSSREESDD